MERHESPDEIIYRSQEDSHMVMSEKVQSLAGSVYQEFEKMIARYDHDVVKDLMPLVVNVLESLDMSYTENQEHEVELELLKEDNEQLVTQYEREKQLRKNTEQKLLEVEDAIEDERKEQCMKIESLESIVRMLELKAKNATDHVFRHEEKESEMKKEYTKLHERYTELFKTHMDYMERTKMMLNSTDRIEPAAAVGGAAIRPNRLPSLNMNQMNRSSGPVSFGFQSLEEIKDPSLSEDIVTESPHGSSASNTSLLNEIHEAQDSDEKKSWSREGSKVQSPEPDEPSGSNATTPMGRSTTKLEQRSGNTLYQELSFQDPELLAPDPDEGPEVVGGWVHPGEFASSGWRRFSSIKRREIRPANDNFFGMGKEVENLIMENNELLATKNALNIVKDDLILKVDELTSEQEVLREELHALQAMKDKLKQRIADLEDELKKVKEEAAKQPKGNKSDDEEEDIPMAQRKRFTRMEMARVLMERNQYKERYMELQEAVRWMELKRAHLKDVSLDKKDKSMWKFFSNLFRSSGEKDIVVAHGGPRPVPMGVLYGAGPPTGPHVTPTLLPPAASNGPSSAAFGYNRKRSDNVSSDKLAIRLANERKEQYRQVRAHVRKDDGRLQAYGWSLPAKVPALVPAEPVSKSHVPVPVPVYCQPLATCEPGQKIWCAAGVNLTGGRTKDGGSIVGGSVFYTQPTSDDERKEEKSDEPDSEPHITKIEEELKEGEKVRVDAQTLEQRLSPLVWICASTRAQSNVTIIDACDAANVLDSFVVCQSYLLCIASVPGAKETDYRDDDIDEETNNNDPTTDELNDYAADADLELLDDNKQDVDGDAENFGRVTYIRIHEKIEDVDKDQPNTVLPTMWLGSQNGWLYVHSAVSNWSKSIVSVQLPDSILSITHCAGRVLASLANGNVILFKRNKNAEWNFTGYHRIELGGPQHSVRCITLVHRTVWCGYKNKIHVLDPSTLTVKMSFEAHPRKESQVRLMAWLGDGVWVSIRLDSTLRLYNAHTYEHLQDVDIEPYVSKMLGTGKLGFSFVRITALLVSTGRLWIGTGNGVIISVPLSESSATYGTVVSPTALSHRSGPGSIVKIYTDLATDKLTPGSFVPYCSMSQAQLSFHGHRDAVKFFIAVPGAKSQISNPNMLVMSGGEGYVDFRIGDGSEDEEAAGNNDSDNVEEDRLRGRKLDLSHLIIWQVTIPS